MENRDVLEEIMEMNPEAMIIDGHDNAIIAMVVQHGSPPLVLYDPNIVIDNLMVNDGMEYDEAAEWFAHNIECAYIGKNTPMMLVRLNSRGAADERSMEEDDS